MYDQRFRKWGFHKNFRRKEALAILHAKTGRDAAGKATKVVKHGRPFDLERFESYLRRNRSVKSQFEAGETVPPSESMGIVCRTPSPSPSAGLHAEKRLRDLEALLFHTKTHIDWGFTAKSWGLIDTGNNWVRKNEGIYSRLVAFLDRMVAVGGYAQTRAYELLAPAFEVLDAIIGADCPETTFTITRRIIWHVRTGDHQLADLLLRYLIALTENINDSEHPSHGIWTSLRQLPLNDANVVQRWFELQIEASVAHQGIDSQYHDNLMWTYAYSMLHLDAFEVVEHTAKRRIEAINGLTCFQTSRYEMRETVNRVLAEWYSILATSLRYQYKLVEAREAAGALSALDQSMAYRELAAIAYAEGQDELEEYLHGKALQLALEGHQYQKSNITYGMIVILYEGNRIEEAEALLDCHIQALSGDDGPLRRWVEAKLT
jgi:hypothetical protein